MPKFTYNDIVRVRPDSEGTSRPDRAWIVGIFEDRPGSYFEKFPEGVVYTIEFEDGSSIEVHEDDLEPDPSDGD
ncbi:hypothetical protein [Undibacterium crateris]|uniref:hypothetical protein n=1 Tax=Undibacterium crateris TaxID=2528175 RepID=UPI001389A2DB|nr:hypothetical protein [Undibacterium crateris]NDI87665.1 hypothetical protein [Undibacterium crateris]